MPETSNKHRHLHDDSDTVLVQHLDCGFSCYPCNYMCEQYWIFQEISENESLCIFTDECHKCHQAVSKRLLSHNIMVVLLIIAA